MGSKLKSTTSDLSEPFLEASAHMLDALKSCDSNVLSIDNIQGAFGVLRRFLGEPFNATSTSVYSSCPDSNAANDDSDRKFLISGAFVAAEVLCSIAHSKESTKNKKRTWEALQGAAGSLQNIAPRSNSTSDNLSETIPPRAEDNALAVCMVFGALAVIHQQHLRDGHQSIGSARAAASALSATLGRNALLRQNGKQVSSILLQAFIDHAYCEKENEFRFDLNIMNHLAKSFKLDEHAVDPQSIALLIRKALPSTETSYEKVDLIKQTVSGAFSLAYQLRPWSFLSPTELIDVATTYDFYHTAEEICRSAHKAAEEAMRSQKETIKSPQFSGVEQKNNARHAVENLIDTAMEGRIYRRADALATSLYNMGGQSQYLKARYFHACDTIGKVIAKRQFPIVDRQIERVDKAVAKIEAYNQSQVKDESDVCSADDLLYSTITLPESPSQAIREYALAKLEEVGEISAAQRLASLYGMEYVYDEEAILKAAALRREKYLQYDDVLQGDIPPLITEAASLTSGFDRLLQNGENKGGNRRQNLIGFDAEWDEETKGVALLQLASSETVLLIDVPALSSTEAGVAALRRTVGSLLNSSEWTVVGFACRQDLSRLRASPCVPDDKEHHWMGATSAVVDVQPMVWESEPSLRTTGLSRACEHYFKKPLDKSEQCSLWSGRPLSERQRCYASLDAWVCVGLYKEITKS